VSSPLLLVELRRLGRREGLDAVAEKLLSTISRRRIDSASLRRASRLQPLEVRTLDAIHLDAAVQLKARTTIEAVLTYDLQLRSGCAYHGLPVKAPVLS
jgi:hypothetical protein